MSALPELDELLSCMTMNELIALAGELRSRRVERIYFAATATHVAAPVSAEAKRVPVDYRYDAINPEFLKWMARLGGYAAEKYGSWEQYRDSRLVGEKSPVNHIYEHLRQFVMFETYDHFDGDVRWHLVAIAYNAMIEFYYVTRWGQVQHPLSIGGKA